jgi:hypothetical protein
MSEIGLAVWGLLGAFGYAGPRLIVALSEAPQNRWKPWADFIVTLAIGTIGAAGFVDLVSHLMHWQSDVSNQRALAVVIGLLSNPVAPAVVKAGPALALRLIGASPVLAGSAKVRENDHP